MAQCLQQAESAPMGQAFMSAARCMAVSTPSSAALRNICWVDLQVVTSAIGNSFFFFSFTSSAIIHLFA
jgi:hypothetical protein